MGVYKNLIEPFLINSATDYYQMVLDFATAQGIALPSLAQQGEDRDMLKQYVACGAWGKTDVFYKFKGTASADFKRICWKRLTQAQAFGGLSWTANGVQGNGTTGYLNTGFVPSRDAKRMSLNSACYGFAGTLNPAGTMAILHAQGVNGHDMAIIPNRGQGQNNYYQVHGQNLQGTYATPVFKPGVNAVNRISSAQTHIQSDIDVQLNYASTGLPDVDVHLLASNPRGGTPALFSTENLQYVFIGASLYTEHTQLRTILL